MSDSDQESDIILYRYLTASTVYPAFLRSAITPVSEPRCPEPTAIKVDCSFTISGYEYVRVAQAVFALFFPGSISSLLCHSKCHHAV